MRVFCREVRMKKQKLFCSVYLQYERWGALKYIRKNEHMKKTEQIIRGVLALFLIAGCYLFLSPSGRFSAQVVLSGSMEPAIKTGGLIFTDKKQKKPEPGEVIMYRLKDTLVTHRVIRKENGLYVTKGDANEKEDPYLVYPDQIEGTVIFFIPFLGYGAFFLRQKTVLSVIGLMLIQELIFFGIYWKGEHRKTMRKHT